MGDADGVNYLIDAAEHVVHRLGRKDIQFLVMGTGPQYPKLVEQRDRLQLQESVDLPGRVSNEFLFTALRTMDIGVSCDPINPYNQHCTMNKVLEYMAFGKAQIMFDLKEGRESAAEAARYIGENSAPLLGEAVVSLLEDSLARRTMGQFGAQRVESLLNWERSVEQLLQAYERVLRSI
jgi:glycosyltransferase involved in cell wall biosynthesis